MAARYYRLSLAVAASLSLLLAGCSSNAPAGIGVDPVTGAMPSQPVASGPDDPMKTDATVWTVLGLATRESQKNPGPQTGDEVSPILWQATLDTLHFVGFSSQDPLTGLLVTDWYSPQGKPDERLRVSVFILSRALRSDSVTVTVERQVRSPAGQWGDSPVARDVVTGLESAILLRARQIHAERYRSTM